MYTHMYLILPLRGVPVVPTVYLKWYSIVPSKKNLGQNETPLH
jgi:hypothetical protein